MFDQPFKSFVVFDFFTDMNQLLFAHELGSALSVPSITKIIIWTMLLGIHGIFTSTGRIAAYIILLG